MSPSPTKLSKSPLLKLLLSSKTSLSSRSSKTHSPQNRSPLVFEENYFQEKLQEPTIKNLRCLLSMSKDEPYIEQIISSLFKDERYKTLSSNPEQLIKLIVEERSDNYLFEQVIEKLYDVGIHDLKIIEDQNIDMDENSESLEGEDTLTILNRYIEETEISLDKTDLKNIIKSIYVEASEVQ